VRIFTKSRAAVLLAGLVLTGGVALSAAPANASTLEAGTTAAAAIDASTISPGTTIVVDSATGQIIDSYATATGSGLSPLTVPVGPGCTTTSLCLQGSGAPYGFTGAGQLSVNVPNRTSYYTGNWAVQLQWNAGSGTVTGAPVGPGVTALFTGSVTVTRVSLA